jgi:hypothetical protein
VNWEELLTRVRKGNHRLELQQAKLIVLLPRKPHDARLPDLVGALVNSIGNSSMDALLAGEEGRFLQLFAAYFDGIIGIYDQLRRELPSRDETSTALMIEPLLDLMEISGWSFLMAEFHRNPKLWESSKAMWDLFLTEETAQRLDLLNAVLGYADHSFRITDRQMLRSRWENAVLAKVRELPRRWRASRGWGPDNDEPDHSSALVRAFGRTFPGIDHEGKDIFARLYLRRHSEAGTRQFGVRDDREWNFDEPDPEGEGQ